MAAPAGFGRNTIPEGWMGQGTGRGINTSWKKRDRDGPRSWAGFGKGEPMGMRQEWGFGIYSSRKSQLDPSSSLGTPRASPGFPFGVVPDPLEVNGRGRRWGKAPGSRNSFGSWGNLGCWEVLMDFMECGGLEEFWREWERENGNGRNGIGRRGNGNGKEGNEWEWERREWEREKREREWERREWE